MLAVQSAPSRILRGELMDSGVAISGGFQSCLVPYPPQTMAARRLSSRDNVTAAVSMPPEPVADNTCGSKPCLQQSHSTHPHPGSERYRHPRALCHRPFSPFHMGSRATDHGLFPEHVVDAVCQSKENSELPFPTSFLFARGLSPALSSILVAPHADTSERTSKKKCSVV